MRRNTSHEDEVLPKAKAPGRNDKIEVLAPGGGKKEIKFKVLQQMLDNGYSQVPPIAQCSHLAETVQIKR